MAKNAYNKNAYNSRRLAGYPKANAYTKRLTARTERRQAADQVAEALEAEVATAQELDYLDRLSAVDMGVEFDALDAYHYSDWDAMEAFDTFATTYEEMRLELGIDEFPCDEDDRLIRRFLQEKADAGWNANSTQGVW